MEIQWGNAIMTISSEIIKLKNNIENIYLKLQEKGATIPEVKNLYNILATIDTISTGGSVSFPQLRYNLDENGNMILASGDLVFSGVKDVSSFALNGAFNSNKNITSVSFPDLVSVSGSYGMETAFYSCSKISSISFPNLTTISGSDGMNKAFYQCNLPSVEFPKLETVGRNGLYSAFEGNYSLTTAFFPNLVSADNYGLAYCFDMCQGLTSVSFPKLVKIGSDSLYFSFYNCTSLTSISFPSLGGSDPTTNIDTGAFGGSYAFMGCSALTEIHFPAASQSRIEACSGYSSKFGASNATIYFDL